MVDGMVYAGEVRLIYIARDMRSGEIDEKEKPAAAGNLLSGIHCGIVTPDQLKMTIPELEAIAGRKINELPD